MHLGMMANALRLAQFANTQGQRFARVVALTTGLLRIQDPVEMGLNFHPIC